MATALDVIKRSMRLIQAIESGEEPTAEEGQDGLSSLNDMMHGFPGMGIERVHTTISSLTSEINMPDEEIWPLKYLLALELAPEYEVEASPLVVAKAESGRRYLQGVYLKVPDVAVDRGLLNMPSQGLVTRSPNGQ